MKPARAGKWMAGGFWAALGLFALWGGQQAASRADLFRLEHLVVEETRNIPKKYVLAAFAPSLGRSLLTLDLKPMIREVAGHTWVRTVRTKKVLPDTLLVQVEERNPRAAVEFSEGLYGVDGAGLILDPLDGAFEPLPRIAGLSFQRLLKGDPESLEDLILGFQLLELVRLEGEFLDLEGPPVADLRRGRRDPRLRLDGFTLRFGEGDYAAKWEGFQSVYRDLRARGLAPEEVDLRFANQVVVKTF